MGFLNIFADLKTVGYIAAAIALIAFGVLLAEGWNTIHYVFSFDL